MARLLNSQMTYKARFILLSIFVMKPSHHLIEMDPRKNISIGMGTWPERLTTPSKKYNTVLQQWTHSKI